MAPIKIAVSSDSQEGVKAKVSDHFGRCPFFTIIEMENNEIRNVYTIKNPAQTVSGGAGPLAVQTIIKEGVSIAIIPQLGPKAKEAMEKAGIQIAYYEKGMTVEKALQRFID